MDINAIKKAIKNSIAFSIYGKSSGTCDFCKNIPDGGTYFCEIKMTRLSADDYNLILCSNCIAEYKYDNIQKRIDEENPLDSLHSCLVFSPRDWSNCKRDAWIYGIIVGWDGDGVCEPADSAINEIAARFNWPEEEVARLRRLHDRYVKLKNMLDDELRNDLIGKEKV